MICCTFVMLISINLKFLLQSIFQNRKWAILAQKNCFRSYIWYKQGGRRNTKWYAAKEVREWTPPRVMILPLGIVMRSLLSRHFKEMAVEGSAPASMQPKSNQKCILAVRMQSSFLQPNLQQLLVWKCKYCIAIRKALSSIQHERDAKDVFHWWIFYCFRHLKSPIVWPGFQISINEGIFNNTVQLLVVMVLKLNKIRQTFHHAVSAPHSSHSITATQLLFRTSLWNKFSCFANANDTKTAPQKERHLHVVVTYNFPMPTSSWENSQHLGFSGV